MARRSVFAPGSRVSLRSPGKRGWRLVADEALIRRWQDAIFAEDERGCAGWEDVCESIVADVEPACVCAEGWHDEARAIGGEATASDAAATADDAGAWMHVPGDFAGRR